jgi:hypothetical protein
MNSVKSISFIVALLVAAPALAQQPRPAAAVSPVRGYLIGGGGTLIGGPEMALTLSAEIAENVTPKVQVYMSAAYYENIMSQTARDQLAQVGTTLTAVTGTPWVFQGRDRGRSFTVGGKFMAPSGSVRPYVGGGVGALNLRRTIREQSRGNITTAYLAQFGSGDGVVDPTQTNTTKPMVEVAGGVGAVIRRAYLDVGYRYRRTFHNVNQTFDLSQISAAIGVKF